MACTTEANERLGANAFRGEAIRLRLHKPLLDNENRSIVRFQGPWIGQVSKMLVVVYVLLRGMLRDYPEASILGTVAGVERVQRLKFGIGICSEFHVHVFLRAGIAVLGWLRNGHLTPVWYAILEAGRATNLLEDVPCLLGH